MQKNDKNNLKNQYRVNEQIHIREVRVVSDEGSEVMPTRKALDLARQQGVDLVEISPKYQIQRRKDTKEQKLSVFASWRLNTNKNQQLKEI